jgi:hypothetical protein
MKVKKTERGFATIKFKDRYKSKCILQKSSLAGEHAVWFGLIDADPLILASKASQYGLDTIEDNGWINYPIPKDVLLHTQMHLTQDQVRALLPYLITFIETGELY